MVQTLNRLGAQIARLGVIMRVNDFTRRHQGTKITKPLEMKTDENGSPGAKSRAVLLSREVIGAAIEVHRHLGPGLLESVYTTCLCDELAERGIPSQREFPVTVTYKGRQLADSHRLDLLVDGLVVVEVKSVRQLEPVHRLQLLTYLRFTNRWLGLLLNFNAALIKDGLQRMLNG